MAAGRLYWWWGCSIVYLPCIRSLGSPWVVGYGARDIGALRVGRSQGHAEQGNSDVVDIGGRTVKDGTEGGGTDH